MAEVFEQNVDIYDVAAAEDLSTHKFKAVTLAGALETTGGLPGGILQNSPDAAGKVASIAYQGICKAMAGATVTAGMKVTSEVTTGRLIQATSGKHIYGTALTGAGDGELFVIMLSPGAVSILA